MENNITCYPSLPFLDRDHTLALKKEDFFHIINPDDDLIHKSDISISLQPFIEIGEFFHCTQCTNVKEKAGKVTATLFCLYYFSLLFYLKKRQTCYFTIGWKLSKYHIVNMQLVIR